MQAEIASSASQHRTISTEVVVLPVPGGPWISVNRPVRSWGAPPQVVATARSCETFSRELTGPASKCCVADMGDDMGDDMSDGMCDALIFSASKIGGAVLCRRKVK